MVRRASAALLNPADTSGGGRRLGLYSAPTVWASRQERHIPEALSISKGSVAGRTPGFGHTAPTYFVGSRDRLLHRLSGSSLRSFLPYLRQFRTAASSSVPREEDTDDEHRESHQKTAAPGSVSAPRCA